MLFLSISVDIVLFSHGTFLSNISFFGVTYDEMK